MIASILFMLLFLVVVSGILYFIFKILLPSLKAQGINADEPLFSKEETDSLTVKTEFRHIDTGLKAIVTKPNLRDNEIFTYDKRLDCTLFASLYEIEGEADNGCIGLGSCTKICTRKAIKIENHTAVILPTCNGCGLCVDYCPRNFIKLVDCTSSEYEKYKNDVSVKSPLSSQKDLQFWKKCYNIINRK